MNSEQVDEGKRVHNQGLIMDVDVEEGYYIPTSTSLLCTIVTTWTITSTTKRHSIWVDVSPTVIKPITNAVKQNDKTSIVRNRMNLFKQLSLTLFYYLVSRNE